MSKQLAEQLVHFIICVLFSPIFIFFSNILLINIGVIEIEYTFDNILAVSVLVFILRADNN